MSEKVTIQDIIELLAEKHSMTKKDAEIFVKGMFELIEEALVTEKYVKVKGLGTFKLTEVESRESVNVNTGERISQLHISARRDTRRNSWMRPVCTRFLSCQKITEKH